MINLMYPTVKCACILVICTYVIYQEPNSDPCFFIQDHCFWGSKPTNPPPTKERTNHWVPGIVPVIQNEPFQKSNFQISLGWWITWSWNHRDPRSVGHRKASRKAVAKHPWQIANWCCARWPENMGRWIWKNGCFSDESAIPWNSLNKPFF